ncbi:MAG: hypothetical protein ACPGSD_10080 [Flavobacteriales bacterium]
MLKLCVKNNLYYLILLVFFTNSICAQSLTFNNKNPQTTHIFNNENNVRQSFYEEYLQNEGFWQVQIDSVSHTDSTYIYGQLGQQYTLKHLQHNLPKTLDLKIQRLNNVNGVNKAVLKHFTNQGHLFAFIQWSIVSIEDTTWIGKIEVKTNELQYIDSVVVKSKEDILKPKKWSNIILPKKKKAVFKVESETDLLINKLGFTKTYRPSKLLLTDKKNLLFIFPEKKKVNYANGIIGFSNDPETTSGFTGQMNIHLENILKSAEQFTIEWRAGNGNQNLKWNNTFRHIYKSFGINAGIQIYRQDSTFTKTELNFGLQMNTTPLSQWNVDYYFEQSAVGNTSTFRKNYTKNLLGVSWESKNIISPITDLKGYSIYLHSKIGNRKSEGLSEAEYQFETNALKIQPLYKAISLVGEINYRQIVQTNTLTNNSFGFGGFSTMKGFIENRFLVDAYLYSTLSARFNQSSAFIGEIFTQYGVISPIEEKNTQLQSLGIQFILPVKSGWFNFGVSSGRVLPQPFSFEQALIHFGIKNNL